MKKRLVELFQAGDAVEITHGDGVWRTARVVKLEHPGVWVVTADGQYWFVTNKTRMKIAALNQDDA